VSEAIERAAPGLFAGPGPDARYQAFLKQGEIRIQQCSNCGTYRFIPRVMCPACGAAEHTWERISGKASVYSTVTVRNKPDAGGDHDFSLIELAEGPRLFSRVEGIAPHDVSIGMAVTARIAEDDEGFAFLVFDPA